MTPQTKCCEGDGEVVVEDGMHAGELDPTSIRDFAQFFKAIGDEKRLTIVNMIANDPGICSCVILKELGISQPTLSHHMRTLTTSGVVDGYRQGKWMHYALSKKGMQMASSYLHGFEEATQNATPASKSG